MTTVEGLENVKFINRSAFEGCALRGSISLDNAVAIADGAFASNAKLESVVLGENIQSIGAYAFSKNTALKTVTIKAPIIKLGQYAFEFCSALESISINAAVIPAGAFNECTSLATIKLGKDVAVIGEYAFSNAVAKTFELDANNATFALAQSGAYLTNKAGTEIALVAPGLEGEFRVDDNKITSVGTNAFAGSTRLTSVIIPSATRVANYAFAFCEKLETIKLGTLELIGDYAFYKTAITTVPSFEKIQKISAYAFAYSKITELTIPDGMIIGDNAFRECKALATVTIGNNVKIGENAFRLDRETNFTENPGYYDAENGLRVYYYIYTSPLHTLTIGDNVEIGNSAFMGAAELESVTLGEGAIIGDSAFFNTPKLKDIDLSKVKSIGESAFSGDVVYQFSDVNMKEPAVDADREYRYSYYAPALTSVNLSSLESLGIGAFEYCRELTSVTLGQGIDKLPARAFNLCIKLTDINLASVKEIGENAFCEADLRNADLSSAEKIDKFAFVYNANLPEVVFGKDGVVLGEGAFSYCTALQNVTGSALIAEVGSYAFAYTSITSIDLTNATRIGDCAFLKETMTAFDVKLSDKLVDIGENPFALCKLSAFTSVAYDEFNGEKFEKVVSTYDISDTVKVIDGMLYRVVPNGLEFITYTGDATLVTVADGTVRITAQAFAGSDVVQVVLPSTLRAIGHKAFYDCKALTMVSFASYEAPVLEEEYDYSYWLSAENIPATGEYQYQDVYTGETLTHQGLGIVPYFMWNATETPAVIYYGANFADYVGRVDQTIVMVKPVNGLHYDSFIYDKYFTLSVDGATAADATTLAAIAAINALPDNITLEHKELVLAARAAYDKITSGAQRELVTNYEKLSKAEQKISDLEYINNQQNGTETTPDGSDSSKQIDVKLVLMIVAFSAFAVSAALAAFFGVLYFKSKKNQPVVTANVITETKNLPQDYKKTEAKIEENIEENI